MSPGTCEAASSLPPSLSIGQMGIPMSLIEAASQIFSPGSQVGAESWQI